MARLDDSNCRFCGEIKVVNFGPRDEFRGSCQEPSCLSPSRKRYVPLDSIFGDEKFNLIPLIIRFRSYLMNFESKKRIVSLRGKGCSRSISKNQNKG